MTAPNPMSTRKRYALHGFTEQELRGELDKRRRADGKPPYQWDEKRTIYLERLITEARGTLAEIEANGSPGGRSRYIHQARMSGIREKIKKYEAWLVLAKADEKKAEARKRP